MFTPDMQMTLDKFYVSSIGFRGPRVPGHNSSGTRRKLTLAAGVGKPVSIFA